MIIEGKHSFGSAFFISSTFILYKSCEKISVDEVQVDENNFVETFYGNEIYADGVGLIYKERNELGKRNGIVVKGLEYRMMVCAFGRE